MADRLPVINSHEDLTEELRHQLTKYYEANDHRMINNDSYSRYPMWCDFGDEDCDSVDEIFIYLKDKGIITDNDHCIIIHWEW